MTSYGNESERLATPNSQPAVSIQVESTTAQAVRQDREDCRFFYRCMGRPCRPDCAGFEARTAAVEQGKPAFDDDYKYARLFGTATVHASSACRSIAYTADYLRKFLDELKADAWRITSVELAVKWLDEAAAELRKVEELYKGSLVLRREEATPHA